MVPYVYFQLPKIKNAKVRLFQQMADIAAFFNLGTSK